MAAQNLKQALGKVIREYRTERKWSQEDLAFEAGIARNHVSLMELGRHSANLDTLEAIAGALGLPGSILLARAEQFRDRKRTSKA